jgi:hypothetical protein
MNTQFGTSDGYRMFVRAMHQPPGKDEKPGMICQSCGAFMPLVVELSKEEAETEAYVCDICAPRLEVFHA